jgi:hypothetical protein
MSWTPAPITTTARHDRHDEHALRDAAERLHVPYIPTAAAINTISPLPPCGNRTEHARDRQQPASYAAANLRCVRLVTAVQFVWRAG